uniref:Uncharacterized protein n=1 Tax=Rhizophora mucronata TaxID=61149 RepID=A0A2P2QSA3_RHIMU
MNINLNCNCSPWTCFLFNGTKQSSCFYCFLL